MPWENATITNGGVKLLSELINGGKLTFTKVEIGAGIVDVEHLQDCTAVSEVINAPALIAGMAELKGKNGKQIHIQVRNNTVTKSVRMRQIGLFAKTESSPEVLFSIVQEEIGEGIPSFSAFPNFLIEFYVVVAVSRTNNISVEIDSSQIFVTLTKLNEVLADVPRVKVIAERIRDPNKPDYGLGGGGEWQGALEVSLYSGNAEVSVVLNNSEYDGKNISRDAENSPDGTMIIKEI